MVSLVASNFSVKYELNPFIQHKKIQSYNTYDKARGTTHPSLLCICPSLVLKALELKTLSVSKPG